MTAHAPVYNGLWEWSPGIWGNLTSRLNCKATSFLRLANGVDCYVFEFGKDHVIKITPSADILARAERLRKAPVHWIADVTSTGKVSAGSNYGYIVQTRHRSVKEASEQEYALLKHSAKIAQDAAKIFASISSSGHASEVISQLVRMQELYQAGYNPSLMRDLTPSNFAICKVTGQVKLIDLGSMA